MRSSGSCLLLVLLALAKSAAAQGPGGASAPADKPAPAPVESPPSTPAAENAPAAEAGPPAAEAEPGATEAGPSPAPASAPVPESAPAPDKAPERAPASDGRRLESIGPAREVAPQATEAASGVPPWIRARSPLTLEGRLGFLLRPESGAGFDEESHAGAELGLSLYVDLKRELAAGLELERASLGRGAAESGVDSVTADYSVTSAMLGFRAYPKRSELIDLFVGLQVGVGIQGVSAAGTRSQGSLLPPLAYRCGGSDAPAFQIGGGVGARFMLSSRWGVTARVNGTGRRLSSDTIDGCVQGLGTATTLSAGIGVGYDFDLDP